MSEAVSSGQSMLPEGLRSIYHIAGAAGENFWVKIWAGRQSFQKANRIPHFSLRCECTTEWKLVFNFYLFEFSNVKLLSSVNPECKIPTKWGTRNVFFRRNKSTSTSEANVIVNNCWTKKIPRSEIFWYKTFEIEAELTNFFKNLCHCWNCYNKIRGPLRLSL